jgi:hypothetical protein
MACMVSNVHMNAEERACCRTMKNQCEQKGMSASHGCCQKIPKTTEDSALTTKAVTYHSVAVAIFWLSATEWPNLNPVVTGSIEYADTSPPQPPLSSISVLRL